jgi:hypothetical protein
MAFYLLVDQAIPPMQVVLVFVALLLSLSIVAALSYVPRLMRAVAVSMIGAFVLVPLFNYCCTCWLCWF